MKSFFPKSIHIRSLLLKIFLLRSFFLSLAALSLSATAFSQKENFDLASFTPPAGWQRIDSNGVILFQKANTNGQLTRFAQIFLFPSQPGSGDPMKDFNAEWNYRVARSTGTKERPRINSQKNPDGWMQTTGQVNITQQGITYTCTLVSVSGFGKEMSFIVNSAGQDYDDDVLVFFKNLDMRAPVVTGDLWSPKNKPPESNTGNTGNTRNIAGAGGATRPGALSDYVFTPPPGWTPKQYSDGIVLSAPHNGSENCSLSMFQMRAAGSNIFADANRIFSEIFNQYEPRNDGMTQGSLIRGISPQGWEYGIVKRPIGMRGYGTVFAFVFVARLGSQIASIAGISKDPMVSNCFGQLGADVWPKFFCSLQFRNWKPGGPGLTRQIVGDWIAATGSASSKFTFAPNGRYGGAAASQYYSRGAGNEGPSTTTAYFGDGAYTLNGNRISLIADTKKNNPEPGLIRVEEESIDNGRTWIEKLYLLRISAIDGKEYEVSYRRNR